MADGLSVAAFIVLALAILVLIGGGPYDRE